MTLMDVRMEDDALGYEVSCRRQAERQRPARRYSPRYEKQSTPTSCRGGIHQRGKMRAYANS